MRKLYFLVPGTDKKYACGGLWAELKTLSLIEQICEADLVTYRQRETDRLFLEDVLKKDNLNDIIFVIFWGFHIKELVGKLKDYHVIYHAHSAGYGFKIPPSMPIVTVSRNTMGYWGQKAPHSPIYYLPNWIGEEFKNLNLDRDIDVLIQKRKSSQYLIKELIPALDRHCNVYLLDTYVEDLAKLFNRAKVYLYDSAEYWQQRGVSEGFGLQPLEAMACGCQVFSSINGGLSDYLDPGFNSHKIAGYSPEYDIYRILKVLESFENNIISNRFIDEYRSENILQRATVILKEINDFFDRKQDYKLTIKPLQNKFIAKFSRENILKKIARFYSP
ncbi:MAG: glycosyltransferase [Prochloraceae cyanobacterium]